MLFERKNKIIFPSSPSIIILQKAQDDATPEQWQRFLKIQKKLMDAVE